MALPPQFMKNVKNYNQQNGKQDPAAQAKKNVAAKRLAKMKDKKAPMVADTDRDGN